MSEYDRAFDRFLHAATTAPDSLLTETEAFGANPGNLRMLHYAPDDLEPGAALVVVLHGCAQSAWAYARGAGWIELADRFQFLVLCPEQRTENNANRCFNWFLPSDVARGAGEAASIIAMINNLASRFAIDPTRVFVTGLSAGGAMTCALLAAYPEMFAAGAVVAGLPLGSAENAPQAFGAMMRARQRAPAEWGDRVRAASAHLGAWPKISIWHGDADRTVAPANARALAAQWVNVHGAPTEPAIAETRGRRAYAAWGEEGDHRVELHMIEGLAHGAPIRSSGEDACGAPGPFLLEADVSSSFQILQFWGISGRARDAGAILGDLAAVSKSAPTPKAYAQDFDRNAALVERGTGAPNDPASARLISRGAKGSSEAGEVRHGGARPRKRGAINIEAVIKKALVAAGLMRADR